MQQEVTSKKINIVQIPLEYYPFALPDLASVSGQIPPLIQKTVFQTPTVSEPPATKKGTSFALGFEPQHPSSPSQHLYKMENHAAILMQLENDVIQLRVYLASPHIGLLRNKANSLLDTLSQLQILLCLVTKCQEQVRNNSLQIQTCIQSCMQ